ncbi:cation efflux family-domain-containing protein [Microdochium trichocladiopsis]|uniref:Cation efflux family-domain-containing protein n=1 Tax=Microdochium trichocladiopsis TaxID=1682393 RepID=A0A9P8YLB3_9PEZI|nr:cation efflux family-domain-containing protein [Microdochium trichocladiopsis]KAH7041080.1 cation efflux family-domain-containing protein [Microdochium trichocladiopsis]
MPPLPMTRSCRGRVPATPALLSSTWTRALLNRSSASSSCTAEPRRFHAASPAPLRARPRSSRPGPLSQRPDRLASHPQPHHQPPPPSLSSRPVLTTTPSTCSPTPDRPSAPSSSIPTSPPIQEPVLNRTTAQHGLPARRPPRRSFPAMGSLLHTRGHGGHHHHHHDNTYLTSGNKNDAGVRITRIGLYSNLGMAIVKGAGGYMFNSQAMVADAIHSVTDLASDVLTLATISWSIRPPTDKFPTGFGKIESLGSLGVSGMLLFGGLWMGYGSLLSLYGHFFLDPSAAADLLSHVHSHGHSHSHGHGHDDGHGHIIPSLHAAWLAAGTIAIKEWLYYATMKVARERKSSVLASNAVHHRVDSWTGFITLGAILVANFMESAAWVDPVGGLLISIMIVKAGLENTIAALFELADRSIDEDVQNKVAKQARQAFAKIDGGHELEVREVTGVKSGQNYLIDVEVAMPGAWTIADTRDIEREIRTLVGAKVRGARRVRVRFVSKDDEVNSKFDEFIPGDMSPKSSPEPEDADEHDDHDHDHHNGHGHKH